jgi:hypothetical protein
VQRTAASAGQLVDDIRAFIWYGHVVADSGCFDLTPESGSKTFHVRRLKGSIDSVHILDRDEVSALRKLKAASTSAFVFVSERGGPLSPDMIARIVERAGEVAKTT